MCQESALVERPSCSSTRNHSVFVQPWPPCSGACSPPDRRASIASRLMRCLSSSEILPPSRSACSSLGIRTSSTKRRARSWRSSCSGVKSAAVAGAGGAVVAVIRFLRGVPVSGCRGSRTTSRTSSRASATSSSALAARASAAASAMYAVHARLLPRVIRRSTRSCSAAIAAPSGVRPSRSVAIAAGSSRSGSGVMESHVWRVRAVGKRQARPGALPWFSPTRAWYHATDHKVRIPFWPLLKPLSAPPHCPPGSIATPPSRSSSSSGSSSATGSSRRTCRACPTPAAT